jgi:3-keto-L-gulonate-6-phosphate decarboxylase
MGHSRSQRHKEQVHGYRAPEITGISPDTASIAAAGAIGRLIATLSVTGGTAPITYAITAAGGLSAVIAGNLLNTSVNPCGTVGAKTVGIQATDAKGKTITETMTVTLT